MWVIVHGIILDDPQKGRHMVNKELKEVQDQNVKGELYSESNIIK